MKRLLKFAVVGTVGLGVDTGVLMASMHGLGWGPYGARGLSFLAAVTTTWWLNRHFTFAVVQAPSRAEWLRYTGLMLLGGGVNYAVYAALVASLDLVHAQPWLGVAAGSMAGLGVNFLSSRRLLAPGTSGR